MRFRTAMTGTVVLATTALTGLLAGPAPAPAAATRQAAAPEWQRCAGTPDDDTVRCAGVVVPTDWERAGTSARTTVRVARLSASRPTERVGTLFFNPGGPGEGAIGYVLSAKARAEYFPKPLRERFDIVAVEPRGVGTNEPLGCAKPVDHGVTAQPATPVEAARLVESNRRLGEACAGVAGPVGEHLDTGSVARDTDHVRALLGEDQVSFLGISYGSMLAQRYAELFPHRVRALALDAVVDRSLSWRQLVEDGAEAVEDGVRRFASWCTGDADCALRDADVRRTIVGLQERADAGELRAGDRTIRAEDVAATVNAGTNTPLLYPMLATALRKAAHSGELELIESPNAAEYRAIICQDVPVPAIDAAAFPAELRKLRRLGPTLRGYSEFWDIVSRCAGWTPESSWRPHQVRVPADFPPTLLLSGAHDVATPRAWAERVSKALPGSAVYRWDGDGHAAWPRHDEGAVRAATAYLTDLALPARPHR